MVLGLNNEEQSVDLSVDAAIFKAKEQELTDTRNAEHIAYGKRDVRSYISADILHCC
jgi:hypothetical protein